MRRVTVWLLPLVGLAVLIWLGASAGDLKAAPVEPWPTATPTIPCPSPVPDATPTPLPAIPSSANLTQENDPAVVLTGTWHTVQDPLALGGAYVASHTPGDTAEFIFSGDSVALLRHLDRRGGRAEIAIDGVSITWDGYGWLRFSFDSPRWQVPAVFDNLSAGRHTLLVTVTGRAGDYGGTAVYIDAFAAPDPWAPGPAQQQALQRVNEYRARVGLPPVKLSAALSLAAQAHAQYIARNGWRDVHEELSCMPGFTGFTGGARAFYFGYPPLEVHEGLAGVGDSAAAIDALMGTVYHREPIMEYGMAFMGTGLVTGTVPVDALEMTGQLEPRVPPSRYMAYTYPIDGQTDVPASWDGAENPDPLPPDVARPVGYPVSVHFTSDISLQQLRLAELRDPAGQLVPVYLVLDTRSVFLVPQQPLLVGRRYAARVRGIWQDGLPFDTAWAFTTCEAVSYLPLRVR